jgi:hypothetical protein
MLPGFDALPLRREFARLFNRAMRQSPAASRAALGAGATGDAVFLSASAAAARATLGFTSAVVDRAYAEYLTSADLTTLIPFDDTIPQVGEGTQILAASITPKSTTNRLRVRFEGWGSPVDSGDLIAAALFLNGGANAVAATASGIAISAGAIVGPILMEYEYVPGTTSAQAFTLRVGGTAGTVRMNGTSTARRFGGVSRCTLIVEEITA